jgi:glycosyltransferase involved in cell wall biosynthesis
MRILYLHQFDLDLAGGSGTYLRIVTSALMAGGHHVEVVSARRPDRYGLTTYALPFDVRLTFGPQRRDGERTYDDLSAAELRCLAVSAVEAIEEHVLTDGHRTAPDVDLVLANHISLPAEIARQLRARHGIPYRVISYGTDTQLLERDPRYVEWLSPAVRDADRVFAISNFVAQQVRAAIPRAEVDVLGGAVDTAVFYPAEGDETTDRIVFVGRLVSEKGVWTLLEAVGRLDGVTLEIVGEGPLMGPLREAGGRAPLEGQVCLRGYLPPAELREVLVRAAVLVVPSLWEEPLGLVVIEAMACGVPVVATAVGGIAEMVQHGRNGLLVEPDDPDALATAIRRLLDDPALRRRFREHCLSAGRIPTPADVAEKVLR